MRYEYKVLTLKGSVWSGSAEKRDADFQSTLNTHGAVGWELVGVSPYAQNVQAFLRREK
ncbi:MAG: DUF4177 domain-containing protein [Litorimonas sp.]